MFIIIRRIVIYFLLFTMIIITLALVFFVCNFFTFYTGKNLQEKFKFNVVNINTTLKIVLIQFFKCYLHLRPSTRNKFFCAPTAYLIHIIYNDYLYALWI